MFATLLPLYDTLTPQKTPCYNLTKGCDFVTYDVNIRIVRALHFLGDTHWNYQGTLYPYNTLYFVLDGDGHIRYNGKITNMEPGNVYLIPPHHQHDIWCDTHVEKVYVDVYAEILPGYDIFSDTGRILSLPIGLNRCKSMLNLCNGGIKERLRLRGELSLILADFMAEEPKPLSAKMLSLLPIITEMQTQLSAQTRREDLAAKYGWNPTVLSRTFKQVFGCGPKMYAEKLLTSRLAEELLLTDKTLQELAVHYGFCDAYYLSAFFKRNMGVAPSIYRQMHHL